MEHPWTRRFVCSDKSMGGHNFYVVKPAYRDHSREPAKVAVIDRWPFISSFENMAYIYS